MTSIALTLSGRGSSLYANYFPPIELGEEHSYECGLLNINTWNSIPNIDESNDEFHFKKSEEYPEVIKIPHGSYEIKDLAQFLEKELKLREVEFELKINQNALRCEIKCTAEIFFNNGVSLGPLLGFGYTDLIQGRWHYSSETPEILKINVIRINCDIAKGAYFNNESAHTIHEFMPSVPAGYKIDETPMHIIYFPITVKSIHEINITLSDQNNRLINLRDENITVRIHIRKTK